MTTNLNMPTQKSVGHNSHAESINNFNRILRDQPWYQEWFRTQGLDPNNVHLSKGQRNALEQLILQKGGVPSDAFNDMMIDPAGNLNTEHGFASQPTWLKAIEIGGAAAAGGYFAAPYIGGQTAISTSMPAFAPEASVSGFAGAALPASTVAAEIAPSAALHAVPALAGVKAATTAPLMSRIASSAMKNRDLISAGGRMVGQMGQAAANNRGVQIDAQLEHDQLQLQADRDQRAGETDAYRKSLYGQLASGYQPSTRPVGAEGRNSQGFITPEAREAGSLMTQLAMERLKSQKFGVGITPFSQLPTKPGVMERIANYAGPAMTLFDPRLYERKPINA